MKNIAHMAVIISSMALLSACALNSDKGVKIRWKYDQQMILVLSSDWNSNQGVLLQFEYRYRQWVHIGQAFRVSLGKNGSAWGVGNYPFTKQNMIKTEGDMRSPAGIFQIGTSFGYARSINSHYPYQELTENDYCIDNSQSPYYNQILNLKNTHFNLPQDSSEPMRRDIHLRGDQLYKLGFVLKYNPQNIPKAGSCIFVHLRKKQDATTAGCFSMDEPNMQKIVNWLSAKKDPVFVLLQVEAYHQKQIEWDLPKIVFKRI